MSGKAFNPRVPLNRQITYVSPYIAVKNTKAHVKMGEDHPGRRKPTTECNRTRSVTLKKSDKDCHRCTRLKPFFWKGHNFQHPQGMPFGDLLFTGEYEVEARKGCADPRDAFYDKSAVVHCPEFCRGPIAKKKRCLTLDMSVLDVNNCESEDEGEQK